MTLGQWLAFAQLVVNVAGWVAVTVYLDYARRAALDTKAAVEKVDRMTRRIGANVDAIEDHLIDPSTDDLLEADERDT